MNIPNSTANNTASNTSDTASGSRSGLTLEGQDLSIRPADDLFHHVNGTWLATHEIPADRALDGAFIQLREDSDARVRSIIDDADTHSRIGALYRSFMDTERLNSLDLTPLEPDLALLSTVTDHRSMALALAELQRVGIGGLLGVFVDQDAKDPSRYVVYLSQSGLSLPDEAYYREPQHADTLAAFHDHVATMLEQTQLLRRVPLTSDLTPAAAADAIVALETAIAKHHLDAASNREAELR